MTMGRTLIREIKMNNKIDGYIDCVIDIYMYIDENRILVLHNVHVVMSVVHSLLSGREVRHVERSRGEVVVNSSTGSEV